MATLHPYFPEHLSLPSYVPNDRDVTTICSIGGCTLGVILLLSWVLASQYGGNISFDDKVVVLWFVLNGCSNVFFEGYFAYDHANFSSKQNILAQLWKEYALSDSRYLTGDSLVLCAESITALVWGPLSFTTAVCIVRKSPWRQPLQIILSTALVYGAGLILATSLRDIYWLNIQHSRPEAYYLWFYFFFLNVIWVVVPGVLLYQSVMQTVDVFASWQEAVNIQSISKNQNHRVVTGRIKQN